MLSYKKSTLVLASILTVLSLASCSREAEQISIVNASANSIYGKVTDFSLTNDDDLKVGDQLKFKVTPNEDFVIEKVTVNGTQVSQVLGEVNTYTWNLVAGENRIVANFNVDPTINFVDEFKLNIDQKTFDAVMASNSTYDFREDGIEEMDITSRQSFINYVDGDTTHITTKQYGYTVKIRYLGIDTPESTSELEEWGKSASLFNESRLSTATHIVLQSQGRATHPDDSTRWASEADTYGRNLAYVWYTTVETPTLNDFRCLNLEMVYEGFSQGIGSMEEMGEYYYYAFDKANLSAQVNKRHQYSGQSDPNYCYAKPTTLTLKQIYQSGTIGATDSYYADEFTLYRVRGYVSRKIGGAFYFQDQLEYQRGADGSLPEAYGMYVFTYAQTPIAVGDYVEVIGVLTSYGGSYQMSGISYHDFNIDTDRDTQILESHGASAVKPIDLTAAEFYQAQYQNVLVNITDEVTCTISSNSYGILNDGGTYEINKYNEKYPFYNTDNEILTYGVGTTNSVVNRIKVSADILISYETTFSYSWKFFTGGVNYFCPNNAKLIYDTNNSGGETALEALYQASISGQNSYNIIKTEYSAKKFTKLTCISQNYISTSGVQYGCSMIIAARSDVGLATVATE